MFRIGDFSKLTQVSVKALRFYDEVGLLKPLALTATPATATTQPRYCRDSTAFWLSKNWAFHWRSAICWKATCRWTACGNRSRTDGRNWRAGSSAGGRNWPRSMRGWRRSSRRAVPEYEVDGKHRARLVASVRDTLSSYADADDLFDELSSHFNIAASPRARRDLAHLRGPAAESIVAKQFSFYASLRLAQGGRRSTNCPARRRLRHPSGQRRNLRAGLRRRAVVDRVARLRDRRTEPRSVGKATSRKTAIRA